MAYPFVPSPHVTKTNGRQIDLIVIHTMEMDEKGETAENCAHWFQNPVAKVSAHYCVDNDSIVQCVRDQDVSWAAPGANSDGVHIEHVGRAMQTGRDWSDPYSTAMLERSAVLAAELCTQHKIPVAWLGAADLVAGKRGLTTHKAVTDALKRGTHWDPGTRFPFEKYLALVRSHLKAGGARTEAPQPLKPDPPTLKRGAHGWQVKRLQTMLRRHGLLPPPAKLDGDFGELTEAAVLAFQAQNDLIADGIVGPMTWKLLVTSGG